MKRIKKLRTGFFSRHLKVAGILTKLAKDYYTTPRAEFVNKLGTILGARVETLSGELGQLKGSLLKAGQMLSMFGKDILPPEVENLFKKLESESSFLSWEEISKQLPSHFLEQLNIEKEPFAAASIGQVHKAEDKAGISYALKIQYRDIDKVIEMDLRILKWLINLLKLAPKDMELDQVFVEMKSMLEQEMDYLQEKLYMEEYRVLVGENYIVPEVIGAYSNRSVLCSEFITAQKVDDAIEGMSQDLRNKMAKDFFTLFYFELFEWNLVQTDAHPGNYLIQDNKWVLLDFGAIKRLSNDMSHKYQNLIRAILIFDKKKIKEAIHQLDLIDWEKTNETFLWDYLSMISSPLREDSYDWSNSDLAKKAINMSNKILLNISLKKAPSETMFIDRKIAGLFYMLKTLKANGDVRPDQFKQILSH